MAKTYAPLTDDLAQPKPASEHTLAHHQHVLDTLPFHDRQSFEDAEKGFIASLEPLRIQRENGRTAYDLTQFGFLDEDAPGTVNPSLWRQAQLNAQHHGLFEVVDGIYQVRSFDIANMTLIRGETGWIIIDPLTCAESSAAALELANEHLGERPVKAVLHTHSHVDHFAGILGVTSAEAVALGEVQIIAPMQFVEEAISENVLAGNVMNRRATYMYGNLLRPGKEGFVTTGLGAALSMGSTGFLPPTDTIHETGERRTVDGVEIIFQMTMGTEAPAEFVFYLPDFRALCMSEITSHHLHNVYTPRGAQVRDALAWAEQIDESIRLFGDDLEVQFASHHWPIWGRERAISYLAKQRDMYKFIHDQTLRLANRGHTKEEIADLIEVPACLAHEFYNRGYYGTVHHNARAVYVKYLGYFDGNPANLYPLPPVDAAHHYLDFMGGADAVVQKAQACFDDGQYRWVAEVLNHVVMADPDHVTCRALLADTYEQLGYQAESGPWRNFYLCGALELRQGLPAGSTFKTSEGIARGMPLEQVFQLLAVHLLPDKVMNRTSAYRFEITDQPASWLVQIENCVLRAYADRPGDAADVTLSSDLWTTKQFLLGLKDFDTLRDEGALQVTGNATLLAEFTGLYDAFPRRFPIVTARD